MPSHNSRTDSESARTEFYEEEDESSYQQRDEDGEDDTISSVAPAHSRISMTPSSDDDQSFISTAERAMSKLHEIHSATDWKQVLKHKKGVVVYVKHGTKKSGKIYKGEKIIKGYSPPAVFAVVGTRKLWDDWYSEGSLVSNLNETTSLTYMCMKGIVGTSTRDLSLVEKVEGSSDGAIFFCSTSVDCSKIPRVTGRVRAQIALNGWILESVQESGLPSTKATYILQVNVKTLVPQALASKYIARRPVCISRIDEYLQRNGAPPMDGVEANEQKGGRASATPDSGLGSSISSGADTPGRRGNSKVRRLSVSSGKSLSGVGFVKGIGLALDHKTTGSIETAQAMFEELAGDDSGWSKAQDHKGSQIFMKTQKGALPVIKCAAKIEGGITTEQVLGTILCESARRIWDDRWATTKLLETVNGFDHVVYLEAYKGLYPHQDPTYAVLVRGVERESSVIDNSTITVTATSTDCRVDAPEGHDKVKADVVGWRVKSEGEGEVLVEYVNKTDMEGNPTPAFLYKINVARIAHSPRRVKEFIDEFGYAPYFVRWGEGAVSLERDEGDLTRGEITYHFSGGGKVKEDQKCWLQWSDRMYERGVNFIIKPSGAATFAKVERLERTLELTWSQIGKDGATLSVEPYEADGAEDVFVNGQRLDRTAAPPKGNVGGAGTVISQANESKRHSKKQAQVADEEDVRESEPKSKTKAGAVLASLVPIASSLPSNPVTPSRILDFETGRRPLPDDAMLIISKDLHFTKQQVAFIAVLLVAVFLFGRLR